MILLGNNLHDRFMELLKDHTNVEIATAWATCGEHLRALADAERGGVKVRAIVGVAGNATHPDALDKLNTITRGDLRIVGKGSRLFHPKLYLFGRGDGTVTCRAWVGSANFTKAGFGGYPTANEEMMLEVGPGARADELAAWFEERWDHYATKSPISEVIRRYTEEWKPPHREVRTFVSGPVIRRVELLEDRPRTFNDYLQALRECEGMLRDQDWEVFDPERGSYMAAIRGRQDLLLGEARWLDFDHDSRQRLTGSYQRPNLRWWGLMGQMNRGKTWSAVRNRQTEIQRILKEEVGDAPAGAFPEIAVKAMRELTGIKHVSTATATLLLTLARPDRLLSVNTASEKALGELSGIDARDLRKPDGYGNLLQWLYRQRWHEDGPPPDEDLLPFWRFRAALVDAFVYERESPAGGVIALPEAFDSDDLAAFNEQDEMDVEMTAVNRLRRSPRPENHPQSPTD